MRGRWEKWEEWVEAQEGEEGGGRRKGGGSGVVGAGVGEEVLEGLCAKF